MAHDVVDRIHRSFGIGHLDENEVFGHIPSDYEDEKPLKFAAVKVGGVFQAIACSPRGTNQSHDGQTEEWIFYDQAHGYIHVPPHPSTTVEDVEGATYAHDDGTYWIFAHCSPGEHRDFAEQAAQFTYGLFIPAIDRANLLLGNANDSNRLTRYHKARGLVDFAEQSATEARRVVLTKYLGFYHKNPDENHRRNIALAAIDKIWSIWLKNGSRLEDRNAIDTTRQTIRTRLQSSPAIEWEFQKDDRTAATGVDVVRGREYCYTLAATGSPIEGAVNLPDPNWHFDAFPNNGITKGTQVYHDGEPTATTEKPFIIRFVRPAPAGTNRGVSIGRVEWTQEPARRVG